MSGRLATSTQPLWLGVDSLSFAPAPTATVFVVRTDNQGGGQILVTFSLMPLSDATNPGAFEFQDSGGTWWPASDGINNLDGTISCDINPSLAVAWRVNSDPGLTFIDGALLVIPENGDLDG